jgi:hypothetical protein
MKRQMYSSNLNFWSLIRRIFKLNQQPSLLDARMVTGRGYHLTATTTTSPTVMRPLRLDPAHMEPPQRVKVRYNEIIWFSGFVVKYKTEMCRNWEVFGYCEFNDSVSINIFPPLLCITILIFIYNCLVFLRSWQLGAAKKVACPSEL